MAFKVTQDVTRSKVIGSGANVVSQRFYVGSDQSPRVNGKLILRSNAMLAEKIIETYRTDWYYPNGATWYCQPSAYGYLVSRNESLAQAEAIAGDKFRSRLHKGDAGLGVNIAGFRQSVSMIARRMNQISSLLRLVKTSKQYHRAVRNLATRRGASGSLANLHLETVFGWIPMIQDVYTSLGVMAADFPPQFISATGSAVTSTSVRDGPSFRSSLTKEDWSSRVTVSAKVVVTNPNLWLANRLGLVNPAVVAWDLVPWSFVVNMFVNVNSILQSYSAFVGLDVSDISTTYTSTGVGHVDTSYVHTVLNDSGTAYIKIYGYSSAGCIKKHKQRILGGSIPRPKLTFKLPNVNLGLATTASALAVQQVLRIQKLVT